MGSANAVLAIGFGRARGRGYLGERAARGALQQLEQLDDLRVVNLRPTPRVRVSGASVASPQDSTMMERQRQATGQALKKAPEGGPPWPAQTSRGRGPRRSPPAAPVARMPDLSPGHRIAHARFERRGCYQHAQALQLIEHRLGHATRHTPHAMSGPATDSGNRRASAYLVAGLGGLQLPPERLLNRLVALHLSQRPRSISRPRHNHTSHASREPQQQEHTRT